NDTPSNFYLGLRLDKARQLLRQTDMSVLEIGVACGFETPSYLSRSYRAKFGVCPSQDRVGLRKVAGSHGAAARSPSPQPSN
ncbi:helix-turn-helix domain-containing protein, partial [Escherichia coli]